MPMTQNGSNSSANFGTYNDYGNVTNVYNESESNKLKRLKDILRPLSETQEADRPRCLKGTRVDLLQQIRTWAQRVDPPNIFVLTGGAGTGKSTVARTIAEEFKSSRSLGCYIFFERGKTDSTTITNTVIKTIAYRLACHIPAFKEPLWDTTKNDHELHFSSTEILFKGLLHEPLHSESISHISEPILVVLDAIDECGDSSTQEKLANLIIERLSTLPPFIRFLITNRPEKAVASLFHVASLSQASHPLPCENVLLNSKSDDSRQDVLVFIKHEMGQLKKRGDLLVEKDWPWDENMEKLGEAADGLFIWASTVIKYISGEDLNQFKCLKNLVENSKTVSKNLNELYATVFRGSINWKDPGKKERFSSIFSLILFGKTLLSARDIDSILDLNEEETRVLLSRFRSVVTYEEGSPIRINHTSLYDYLIGCKEEEWYIDEGIEKNRLVSRCFVLMKSQLRFNICDLETSFKFNRDVPDLEKRVNERIHSGLLYACRYWASHLQDVPYSDELLSDLDNFAYNQLLYWLEVLSLTKSLYEYLEPVLEGAIGWVKNKDGEMSSKISSFLEDALHHVYEFIQPISESTPHLYMTFLPLKRSESDVARHYSTNMKELTCIEYFGDRKTLGCISQTNVKSSVCSIFLFIDGDRVLCGTPLGAYLWNTYSEWLIEGPFGEDMSVSCYKEETSTVVVVQDGVFDEWDADTGRLDRTLIGDIERVTSVALDAKRAYYATGFESGAIQLWDLRNKMPIGEPLMGHSGKVLALSFNKVGHEIASGSEDQSIIIWHLWSLERKYLLLKGHSGPITSLAFTFRCRRLVSGSLDGTVRLWDVSSGEIRYAFSASGMGGVYSVASFADDHRYILSGSEDGIIRMWDTEHSEVPPRKFVGHTSKVISLSTAYTHRGRRFASGSSDGTIRVWEVIGNHSDPDDSGRSLTLGVSPSGKYLVSGSTMRTMSVWRVESRERILGPLKGHWATSILTDVCFVSGSSKDGTVRIWNLEDDKSVPCSREWNPICFLSGEPLVDDQSHPVTLLCYSPDGKRCVSKSKGRIIHIWDASSRTVLFTLQAHSDRIVTVTYSSNGAYILSGYGDGMIHIWDVDNGKLVHQSIKAHEKKIVSACFSPDGTYFIAGSQAVTVRRWETSSESESEWSRPTANVRVWNISTGELLFEANVGMFDFLSVVFLPSSDSNYIKFASASDDGLIRIWSVDVDSKEKIWNTPKSDGWVIGNDGNLLSWLPLDIRLALVYGSCAHILNSRFSTKLTLSKYQGNQWTSCFPSPRID